MDQETADAHRRTRLANERTYLAWWRGGLTALAVGVGAGAVAPELTSGRRWPFVVLGIAFSALAVAFISFGVHRQRRVEQAIDRAPPRWAPGWPSHSASSGSCSPCSSSSSSRSWPDADRARRLRHRAGGAGVGAARRAARVAPDGAPLVLVGAADIGAAALGQPLGGDIDMGPMPIGPYMSLDELEGAVRSDLERAEVALTGRPGSPSAWRWARWRRRSRTRPATTPCWPSTRPRRGGSSGSSTATRPPG